MSIKPLLQITEVPDSTTYVKIPKKAGEKPQVFYRYLTKGKDHFGSGFTSNAEVWFPAGFNLVTLSDGGPAVMLPPDFLQDVSDDHRFELGYLPEVKKPATGGKSDTEE